MKTRSDLAGRYTRKRQLRVKTGIVVPSFIGVDRTVSTRLAPSYVGLVPLNACPNGGNCGCWYCRKSQGAEW